MTSAFSAYFYIVNRGRHRGLEFEPLFEWATSAVPITSNGEPHQSSGSASTADGGAASSSTASDNQFVQILKEKTVERLGM